MGVVPFDFDENRTRNGWTSDGAGLGSSGFCAAVTTRLTGSLYRVTHQSAGWIATRQK